MAIHSLTCVPVGGRATTIAGVMLLAITLSGCNPSPKSVAPAPASVTSANPLSDMKAAVRGELWQEAWLFADDVRAKYPQDADALAMVAKVAYKMQHPDQAAQLMVDACRAESFKSEQRVQQAMIALVEVGRLHDGMDLLEEALVEHPLQLETRRWLYDFCMGTEDRPRGLPHGQFLVRHRKFDLEFLLALNNTQRRTLDAAPLVAMASRNPDDIRPLVGDARIKFDESKFDDAIKIASEIVAHHPTYIPAQLLLGRALASGENLSEIEVWVSAQDPVIQDYSDYWLTLGDWARAKGHRQAAVRAYWEAARRDPDASEPWSKLSAALKGINVPTTTVSTEMLSHIDRRADLLSSLNQAKYRFDRTGKISRAISSQIIENLRDLGRLWEAEAWASIAMTLPEDESIPVAKIRDDIVATISRDTPWQLTDGFPELNIDLSQFELPEIARRHPAQQMASGEKPTQQNAAADAIGSFKLNDEATARGLTFYGRTGDKLNQPGIMLFQTLGCGGGAIDFDLDGWCDLYLMAAGGTPPARDSATNVLMRNQSGIFANVTEPSNSGDNGFGQGIAVGDVNEDGFSDLLVLNYGPNALFINNGDGTFADASDRIRSLDSPHAGTQWSTCGAIADLDGDAISDLVIVNYCAGLDAVTVPGPLMDPEQDSELRSAATPVHFPALGDQFFKGQATGTFVECTDDWQAIPESAGRGLGIVVGNFDKTPGVDVFIANDMTNNHYWSTSTEDRRFRLRESGTLRGLATDDRLLAQGSMGIACADLDQDGDFDFYVTNFDREYNTYHEQVHAGIWQDRTTKLGLTAATMPLVGFGTQAIDLDNDGVHELIVTNGHVDLFSRGRERAVYAQPLQIFRRGPDGTFTAVDNSLVGEYANSPHVGRSLWLLDVDRDGRSDVVVTHQTEPVALLINEGETHGDWLELQLRGRSCSRDAIGAVVTVIAGERQWTLPLTSGDGYLCSNERLLRFGLGKSEGKISVQVAWPDGSDQTYHDVEANGRWLLVQSNNEPFQVR